MYVDKLGGDVSHTALSLAMPEHAPLPTRDREIALTKGKNKTPRTAIGKDIAAKNEETAREVHNSLRQIGLTVAYASLTVATFLRGAGLRSLDDRGQEVGTLRRETDHDPQKANSIAAGALSAESLFKHAAYDDDTITFTMGKLNGAASIIIDPYSDNFETVIKRVLPAYNKPVGYEKAGYSSVNLDFGDKTDEDFDLTIAYDDLVKAIQGTGIELDTPLFCGKAKLPKGVRIDINLQGSMRASVQTVTSFPSLASLTNGKGSITSNMYAIMPVVATVKVTVPKAWAMWATYADNDSEFVPTLAMSHFSTLLATAVGTKGGRSNGITKRDPFDKENEAKFANNFAKISARISNVATAKRLNQSRAKVLGFEAKIRTNKDGYAILPNGELWFIPPTDNVAEFVKLSKEASDGTIDGSRFDYPSRILYVDAVNEVLVHTTASSTIHTVDLRGSRPLDDISQAKYSATWALNPTALKHLSLFNGADLPVPAAFIASLIRNNNKNNEVLANVPYFADLWRPIPENGSHAGASAMQAGDWSQLIRLTDGKNTYMISDPAERERLLGILALKRSNADVDQETVWAAENRVIGAIHEAALAFTTEAQKFAASGGLELNMPEGAHSVSTTNQVRIALYAFTHLLSRWPECESKRQRKFYANTPKPLDRMALKDKPIAIPNVDIDTGLSYLFPHQAEVVQNIDIADPPEAAVIGGAPGFGKTNVIMADVLLLLQKGKIKRPLVVVPNKLEGQFISEINRFTRGRVNAYCATFQNLKDMQSPDGLNFSYEETVKFLRDLPPNTILVTNYNTLTNSFSQFPQLYDSMAAYDTVGTTQQLMSFPFVDMFYAAGVDYVCGDESHKVKNLKAGRGQAFLALCAKVDYIRLSSGTTVNNVVSDLVGQMQKINPLALGASVEAFQKRFLGGDKQVTRASQAEDITEAMREYAMVIQKDSRSWAYMLPPLTEIYHRVELTTLQARYYAILFYKMAALIERDAAKRKIDLREEDDLDSGGRGRRRRRPSDDEMDDASPEQSKRDSIIEAISARHFGVIDRFVNSPDTFVDFVDGSWTADEEDVRRAKLKMDPLSPTERASWPAIVPSDNDLVSVKAKWAYTLMYAHFNMHGALAEVQANPGSAKFRADPENKVITLSPYKVTGTHLYDKMPADLKAMTVRYQAGNFVEVERFKRDDKIKIVVADEISITEGHNLQMASRTIRMQGVWTPGSETQALARTRRPDPGGKRQRLGYDHIVATLPGANAGETKPTIDDLRTARLLAKKLSNSRVEFGYELSYQRAVGQVVSALPPVKMSMKNIEEFKTEQLAAYFDALTRLNNWMYDSSKAMTKQIGKEIFEATGEQVIDENGNPIDLGKFVAAAVVKTAAAPELPGSRRSYVPWVGGSEPINPLGFEMIPVRSATPISLEDDEDDGDEGDDDDLAYERISNNVEIDIGTYVMTEYGPGIVSRVGRRKRGSWAAADDMSPDAFHDASFYYISIPSIRNGKEALNVRLAANRIFVPVDDNGKKMLRDAIKNRTSTMAPVPNPITGKQVEDARDRKAGRKAEEDRRSKNPSDDGSFADYSAPTADDFDFDDEDFDFIVDDEDEAADPVDILADMLDENGNIDFSDEVDDDEDETDDQADDEEEFYGFALAINGQLALLVDSESQEDNALDGIISDYGFKRFPNFTRLHIKTKAALDAVLTRLAKKRYVIPPQNMAEIQSLAKGLTQRGALKQTEPFNFREVTNFMMTEQRRVPAGTNGTKPFRVYALVQHGLFYLVASTDKHPFRVKQAFTDAAAGVAGVGKIKDFYNQAVMFVKNKRQAQTVANNLISAGLISNEEEFLSDLAEFRVGGPAAGLLSPPEREEPAVPKTVPTPKAPVPAQVTSDYREGPNNPDVENLAEFRNFLQANKPVMVLVKGTMLPTGVPYMVKGYSNGEFALSNRKNQARDDYEMFHVPGKADVRFDNTKGLMYVGKTVWRLSYTAS
jgi:hypothetical protein